MIEVRRVSATAKIPETKLDGSALDLYYNGPTKIVWSIFKPTLMGTGIAMSIPRGFEGSIRGRSGNNLKGVIIPSNCIDWNYTGELFVAIYSFRPRIIRHGDRIAQIVISPTIEYQIKEVSEFTGHSVRGTRALGSTGR